MVRKPPPRKPATNQRGADEQESNEDVALICGVAANGSDLHVLRRRNNRLEAGVARALREGQPIQGELVRLRPRERFPLLCDVEVELAIGSTRASEPVKTDSNPARVGPAHGPAQVSSDSYRRNWDAIWKRSAAKKMVN